MFWILLIICVGIFFPVIMAVCKALVEVFAEIKNDLIHWITNPFG